MQTARLRLLPVVIRDLIAGTDASVRTRRLSFRVWPTDLDINLHVNNARYLSFMDIGRWDLFLRLGMMQHAFAKGQKPVVVDIGIRFKKSLQPGQKFVLETELTHTHSKIFYMEQRFLVSGRGDSEVVYAQAQIKGMILDKAGKIMHAGKALAALNHGQALVEERGQDKDETNQTKG